MSKTFKPIIETDRQLKVEQTNDARADFCLGITEDFKGTKYVSFDKSHAPALALAILEAAGYKEHSKAELGSSELLTSYGLTKLRQAVQAQEREESKEQAKLEAEALELFKTLMGVKGYENFTWSEVVSKDEWLAVARKARELAKGSGE